MFSVLSIHFLGSGWGIDQKREGEHVQGWIKSLNSESRKVPFNKERMLCA